MPRVRRERDISSIINLKVLGVASVLPASFIESARLDETWFQFLERNGLALGPQDGLMIRNIVRGGHGTTRYAELDEQIFHFIKEFKIHRKQHTVYLGKKSNMFSLQPVRRGNRRGLRQQTTGNGGYPNQNNSSSNATAPVLDYFGSTRNTETTVKTYKIPSITIPGRTMSVISDSSGICRVRRFTAPQQQQRKKRRTSQFSSGIHAPFQSTSSSVAEYRENSRKRHGRHLSNSNSSVGGVAPGSSFDAIGGVTVGIKEECDEDEANSTLRIGNVQSLVGVGGESQNMEEEEEWAREEAPSTSAGVRHGRHGRSGIDLNHYRGNPEDHSDSLVSSSTTFGNLQLEHFDIKSRVESVVSRFSNKYMLRARQEIHGLMAKNRWKGCIKEAPIASYMLQQMFRE